MKRDTKTSLFSVRIPNATADALLRAQKNADTTYRKLAEQAIITYVQTLEESSSIEKAA